MAYYSGPNGELWIDGAVAGQVKDWRFTTTVAVMDTTALGQTDGTSNYGLRNTAGSCTLFYWQDGANTGGDCSTLIQHVVQGRTNVAVQGVAAAPRHVNLRLKVDDGSTDGRYIRGEVLITAVNMAMSQGEIFSANIGFQFIGAPVEATL